MEKKSFEQPSRAEPRDIGGLEVSLRAEHRKEGTRRIKKGALEEGSTEGLRWELRP